MQSLAITFRYLPHLVWNSLLNFSLKSLPQGKDLSAQQWSVSKILMQSFKGEPGLWRGGKILVFAVRGEGGEILVRTIFEKEATPPFSHDSSLK